MENKSITPFLESIIYDNENYSFPVDIIREELMQMLLNQIEMQYFIIQAHKKLNKQHSIYGTIFLNTLEHVLDTKNVDTYTLSNEDYFIKIEELIEVLEQIKITRIPKDSPDGEVLTAML